MNDHALQNLRRFDSLVCVCVWICMFCYTSCTYEYINLS